MVEQTVPIETVAGVAQRLAVLLAAGVSPPAAWGYLAESHADATRSSLAVSKPTAGRAARSGSASVAGGAPGAAGARGAGASGVIGIARLAGLLPGARRRRREEEQAAALAARILQAAAHAGTQGTNVAEAIREVALEAIRGHPSEPIQRVAAAWLALAAAWSVAHESGAPLAATLRQLAEAFRDQAQLERDLSVALSGPRATARMVGLMPAIGVLFGSLMGFDTITTLLLTAPGLACLVVGSALMAAGARWSATLVRQAAHGLGGEGQLLGLAAIAMTGGASTERARTLAEGADVRFAASARRSDDKEVIDEVLALSRRAGIPAAELLRSEAQQARLWARSAGQQRAARLAVSLMIPLGICVLPAFMLLGVVPLLISVLSSTLTFI